ncbi:DNA topoisomerase 2 [Heracleum sosnowskyi]|uniref:DNA topoisomerase 2 n=1 Tax=Heracleum sosnowskyi TaxID=360622 RepID=A0AAD8MF03_9APIA|nr:DNA topoisomerase 2 [Heracleum sosnowskyi]
MANQNANIQKIEHILLRPDLYIGSMEKHTASLWVFENNRMIKRSISYVPGLYNIFDDVLVNAADNKQMDFLKVVIDVEDNFISVYNNGDGEGVSVPELTTSKYNDNPKKKKKKTTGYGVMLANIFSTEFAIETADGKTFNNYKQVFSNNMRNKSVPNITKCNKSDNWTKVSFKPDLAKFRMTHLEDDVVALMKKRVVDIAGCLGRSVKVELNGERVPVNSFTDYIDLYLKSANKNRKAPLLRFLGKVNARWEICVSLSGGQFEQVSFVNGIATIKGGTHVDYVTNHLTNHVITIVNEKKHVNLKAHAVKKHLWVFVNALIDDPAFDSHTKEKLITRQSSFASKCELSKEFLEKVVTESGVVETLLSWADVNLGKELKKTDGTKKDGIGGIPKLKDAYKAGTSQSRKCTLMLTQGDSAKSLAMIGLSVMGREYYGVLPLRGKLLNVKEATSEQIEENAEIQNIKKILGLQDGIAYDDVTSLRYGHLMIMTDQDHDGFHIKGLLINFIHSFWPSLLKIPSFMTEFITPIVKATKNDEVLSFYTIPEYEYWRESLENNALRGWTITCYKGLGASSLREAKQYFSDLETHKRDFKWDGDDDGDAIEIAFNKKKIEERKNWLRQFKPRTFSYNTEKLIKYSDFVKEVMLSSMLQRSIPSMVDGLIPVQRKILFCSFQRKLTEEALVAHFSGYVLANSAYHDGEQSPASIIVGMAQDFVGSNNINLLLPNGQFGGREDGGKYHASAGSIFTQLAPISRYMFPEYDDILLDYLYEDGQKIEPTWYVPIVPMVLVNGSEGAGLGWSTYVPNYNPRDIVANIRLLLRGEPMQPMDPWYKGFRGTIEKTATKEAGASYTVSGIIEEIDDTKVRITELPIRTWTQDYKEFLDSRMTGNDKVKEPFIKNYSNRSFYGTVHFNVEMSEENMINAKQEGLLKKFNLTTTISTSNMHLFDPKGVIKKYDNPEQILEDFYHVRLDLYKKRRASQLIKSYNSVEFLLKNLKMNLLKLESRVKFIEMVMEGIIDFHSQNKEDIRLKLQNDRFPKFPKNDAVETEENSEGSGGAEDARVGDYDYLLLMGFGTYTTDGFQELREETEQLRGKINELTGATPMSLWEKDLDALGRELDARDRRDAVREASRPLTYENRMIPGGPVPLRKAPDNPQKTTKPMDVASVSAMETDKVYEVVNPRGKAGQKKASARKGKSTSILQDGDEDDASNILNSSPENSEVMKVEVPQKQATKKPPSRKNATVKKISFDISEDEDQEFDFEVISDDDEFEVQVAKGKKGRRKPAGNAKAAKPPAAPTTTKKRGPAESAAVSPEKKVRKMRASPFNKKSSSLLGRTTEANRTKTTYVLSDTEDEEDANEDEATDVSEFSENED